MQYNNAFLCGHKRKSFHGVFDGKEERNRGKKKHGVPCGHQGQFGSGEADAISRQRA